MIYDALTGDQKGEFRFSAPVVMASFGDDGRALLAVTAEQEAITVAVP